MADTGKRDAGKGLTIEKVAPGHWRVEGYDLRVYACWEGTHTSRWVDIEKDGQPVTTPLNRPRTLSDAYAWVRQAMIGFSG